MSSRPLSPARPAAQSRTARFVRLLVSARSRAGGWNVPAASASPVVPLPPVARRWELEFGEPGFGKPGFGKPAEPGWMAWLLEPWRQAALLARALASRNRPNPGTDRPG